MVIVALCSTHQKGCHAPALDVDWISLHQHRSSVAEHLGEAGHQFRGVVAHADDCIRTMLLRMPAHELISLRPRLFAEVGIDRDVAAEERLQSPEKVADDRARTDRDASNDTEASDDFVSGQRESRCDH